LIADIGLFRRRRSSERRHLFQGARDTQRGQGRVPLLARGAWTL